MNKDEVASTSVVDVLPRGQKYHRRNKWLVGGRAIAQGMRITEELRTRTEEERISSSTVIRAVRSPESLREATDEP
jgi:hypothetical protein